MKFKEEIYFNLIPTRAKDRVYGLWDFLAIQICFGIAAWFFLAGSLTGLSVRAVEAIPIILFGNCIPLFLIAAMAVIFARYGVEHWLGSAAVLGHRFKDIWLLIYITSSFGWIAYASFLFGESAIKFVKVFNGPEIFTEEIPGAMIFAIIATLVGTYVAYLGPTTLKYFTRTSSIFLLVVLGFFIWTVFSEFGVSAIFNAQPAKPFETLAPSLCNRV